MIGQMYFARSFGELTSIQYKTYEIGQNIQKSSFTEDKTAVFLSKK